ncbi:Hypothetical_protein [Hexamita inflata]|uniref:Hypothetical_protein n=2 Tax=Hexamita inflata TaxID=28002 RepID=A0AA86UJ34_9EUKA|nr:Hypothetical protein HINF_LOCUS29583 [Hexamita inflata]
MFQVVENPCQQSVNTLRTQCTESVQIITIVAFDIVVIVIFQVQVYQQHKDNLKLKTHTTTYIFFDQQFKTYFKVILNFQTWTEIERQCSKDYNLLLSCASASPHFNSSSAAMLLLHQGSRPLLLLQYLNRLWLFTIDILRESQLTNTQEGGRESVVTQTYLYLRLFQDSARYYGMDGRQSGGSDAMVVIPTIVQISVIKTTLTIHSEVIALVIPERKRKCILKFYTTFTKLLFKYHKYKRDRARENLVYRRKITAAVFFAIIHQYLVVSLQYIYQYISVRPKCEYFYLHGQA